MPFLLIFLCTDFLLTKSTSSSFFLWVTNQICTSYKLSLQLVVQHKFLWLSEFFHPYREVPSRKGKYPVLRKNTKPRQLIKYAKICCSMISLVFCKFSCSNYQNGLNWGTQSWGTPSTSKSSNHVSFDT